MADRFDKFTERARMVLTLAQDEAQRFKHNYIGTEHLLLGLVQQEGSIAGRVLANLGVQLQDVRNAVEFIIGRGEDRPMAGLPGLTPRAKKVIELSVDEARRLNHHYIGTEHLLLGLVREGEGIAAGVLESLGISLAMVRAEVVRVLSASRLQARERGAAQDEPVAPTEAPASASALQRAVEAVRAAKDAAVAEQDYLRASELRDIETRLEQMLDS